MVLVCLAILALSQSAAMAQQATSSGSKIVQIPLVAGDNLQVRFTQPFNAGDLAKGLVPTAEVAEAKVITGVVMVAAGAPVTVAVTEDAVEDNGRAGKPGRLQVVFESVEAVDGTVVPLAGTIDREGSGRGIILKIFTLFLIKGEDPEITPDEIFSPTFAENTYIYAEQP